MQTKSNIATIQRSAVAFAKADLLTSESADLIRPILEAATTPDHWEAISNAWRAKYAMERKTSDQAASQAWSRLIAQTGIAKPKAAGAKAKKMRESQEKFRKMAEAQTAQIIAQAKQEKAPILSILKTRMADVRRAAGDAFSAGDNAVYKTQTETLKALEIAEKKLTEETRKAATGKVKEIREKIRAAIGACSNLEALTRILTETERIIASVNPTSIPQVDKMLHATPATADAPKTQRAKKTAAA